MEQGRHQQVSDLLTPKQLVEWLQLGSERTVEKWRSTGAGPTYLKVGRLVRYRKADVEAWLEENTVRCGTSQSTAPDDLRTQRDE